MVQTNESVLLSNETECFEVRILEDSEEARGAGERCEPGTGNIV